jgi:hypothetical protein
MSPKSRIACFQFSEIVARQNGQQFPVRLIELFFDQFININESVMKDRRQFLTDEAFSNPCHANECDIHLSNIQPK